MKLICHECWNYTYFEADVETLKELVLHPDHTMIQDSLFEHWNYSESMLRDNLEDIVQYVLSQDAGALTFDHDKQVYINRYISCARCGSNRVTKPYSSWNCNQHQTLEQELLENRKELIQLRKENQYGHHLPVLWKK